MQEKVYLCFFFLCVISSQGTLATFLKEDVGESSKLLVRQKRVIDRREGGERPLTNKDATYVVNLKKDDRFHCIATILSHRTAITAARCVESPALSAYRIYSGTSYSRNGIAHNITGTKVHGHNPSRASTIGIALLTVNPPFAYSQTTGSIGLHSGPVLEDMLGTVFGWGTHVSSGRVETAYPQRLRFIIVPIMNHRVCQSLYGVHFPITEEEVCTYHPQKLCGKTDAGAPLVIDNQLAGVHIGEINITETQYPIKPDIFVLLQHLNYGPWIMRNIFN